MKHFRRQVESEDDISSTNRAAINRHNIVLSVGDMECTFVNTMVTEMAKFNLL